MLKCWTDMRYFVITWDAELNDIGKYNELII